MRSTVHRSIRGIAVFAIVGCVLCVASCAHSQDHADLAPTNSILLEVTGHGTADITWSGKPGGHASRSALPWRTTVREPATAQSLVLTVVLDQHGGTAACSIAINGRRVGSSLAQGQYGRATCHTPTTAGTALQSND